MQVSVFFCIVCRLQHSHSRIFTEYWYCRKSYDAATKAWLNTTEIEASQPLFYSQQTAQTRSTEAAHSRGLDSVLTLQQSARNFEAKLKIERWKEDSPEWIRASKSGCERSYDKAIDKLESLVVARVFELSKMNHAGTGNWNQSKYTSTCLTYWI